MLYSLRSMFQPGYRDKKRLLGRQAKIFFYAANNLRSIEDRSDASFFFVFCILQLENIPVG